VVPARTRKRVEIVARFARSRAVRRLVPSKSVVSTAAEVNDTLSTGLERLDAPGLAVFATRDAPLLKTLSRPPGCLRPQLANRRDYDIMAPYRQPRQTVVVGLGRRKERAQ
jgi:hypothetical protein